MTTEPPSGRGSGESSSVSGRPGETRRTARIRGTARAPSGRDRRNRLQEGFDAAQHRFASEELDDVEEGGADGLSRQRQPERVDDLARGNPLFGGEHPEHRLESLFAEIGGGREPLAERGEKRGGVRADVLLQPS